jgi:predicted CoA-binding protein
MSTPLLVQQFLSQRRIAVAGVSRQADQPANAILRKLRGAGYEAFAVNPAAQQLEGGPCYPDLAAIPGGVTAVMVVTPASAAAGVVEEAAALGIRYVWLHRSFGEGSVSSAAVRAAQTHGMAAITGGCPMMFVAPVDPFHRVMRWFCGPQREAEPAPLRGAA